MQTATFTLLHSTVTTGQGRGASELMAKNRMILEEPEGEAFTEEEDRTQGDSKGRISCA